MTDSKVGSGRPEAGSEGMTEDGGHEGWKRSEKQNYRNTHVPDSAVHMTV
jgi:hypothetical protein